MERSVVAPGKITLVGEYGVLEGGPVLVAAVDRLATARAGPRLAGAVTATKPSPASAITLTSPLEGLHDVPLGLPAPETRMRLASETVRSTLGYLSSRGRNAGDLHIDLDLSAFHDGDESLGLGSSGASAVAIAGSLLLAAGVDLSGAAVQWDLLTLAAYAESIAKGAQASGSDVAAAVYGGTLVYRRGGAVRKVELPAGVLWAAVRAPGAGTTGSVLFRVPGDSGGTSSRLAPILREVAQASERTIDRLEESSAAFLEAVRDFRDLTDRLGQETGSVTVGPAMRKAMSVAAEHGAIAKPTPTGGRGELGLIFAGDPDTLEAALAACEKAGLTRLDIALEPRGVRAE